MTHRGDARLKNRNVGNLGVDGARAARGGAPGKRNTAHEKYLQPTGGATAHAPTDDVAPSAGAARSELIQKRNDRAWQSLFASWQTPTAAGAMVQTKAVAGEALGSAEVHARAAAGVAGAGSDVPFRAALEDSFGVSLSGVRAHLGVDESRAVGALAYARGNDVAFAEQSPDKRLVAHELTHVFQQRDGVQLKGGVGAADDVYERQADEVADRVVRGESVAALLGLADGFGGETRAQLQCFSVATAGAPRREGDVTLIQLASSDGLKENTPAHISWEVDGRQRAITCFVVDVDAGLCRTDAAVADVEAGLAATGGMVEVDANLRHADDTNDASDDVGARRQVPEGYWLGQMIADSDVAGMTRDGIRLVLDLDGGRADPETALADAGIEYVAASIGNSLSTSRAQQILEAAARYAPSEVLIHCQHGADRTGAVVAFLLVMRHGWEVTDAMYAVIYAADSQVAGLVEVLSEFDEYRGDVRGTDDGGVGVYSWNGARNPETDGRYRAGGMKTHGRTDESSARYQQMPRTTIERIHELRSAETGTDAGPSGGQTTTEEPIESSVAAGPVEPEPVTAAQTEPDATGTNDAGGDMLNLVPDDAARQLWEATIRDQIRSQVHSLSSIDGIDARLQHIGAMPQLVMTYRDARPPGVQERQHLRLQRFVRHETHAQAWAFLGSHGSPGESYDTTTEVGQIAAALEGRYQFRDADRDAPIADVPSPATDTDTDTATTTLDTGTARDAVAWYAQFEGTHYWDGAWLAPIASALSVDATLNVAFVDAVARFQLRHLTGDDQVPPSGLPRGADGRVGNDTRLWLLDLDPALAALDGFAASQLRPDTTTAPSRPPDTSAAPGPQDQDAPTHAPDIDSAGAQSPRVAGNRLSRAAAVAHYVEQHRGNVPFGVAMAICENESGFDAEALNDRSGALGLWQVVPQYYEDYNLDNLAQRTDPDASTRGVLIEANERWQWLLDHTSGVSDDDMAGLLYYAHAEGGGSMRGGVRTLIDRGDPVTLEGVLATRDTWNSRDGFRVIAYRWREWEAAREALLSGGEPGNAAALDQTRRQRFDRLHDSD